MNRALILYFWPCPYPWKGTGRQCASGGRGPGGDLQGTGRREAEPEKKSFSGTHFKDLLPGDVVLLGADSAGSKLMAATDSDLTSGGNVSIASHTVIYLKEVNGKKLFLDNQPFEGPRIIMEDEFLRVYGRRGAEVARLAEPLNGAEGKRLVSEAVRMAQENRRQIAKNWFGSPLLGTHYGAWGKDDVVCSEADWVLINNAGRKIPASSDRTQAGSGVGFSPADYVNSPYSIVTSLGIPY